MLTRQAKRILPLIALVLFVGGCKKDKDAVPPRISIDSPYEGQSYQVFDTIRVTASIQDDRSITDVNINLLNEQLVPVQASITVNVHSPGKLISEEYIITNTHLVTGIYFLQVNASDGVNQTKAYKKIHITETPLSRKGIYFLSRNTPTSLGIFKIDTTFTVSPQLFLYGDYSASAVNSYYQYLYVAGGFNGNFNAIDLETNAVQWSVTAIPGFFPYFRGIYCTAKTVYVSFHEEKIKGYDVAGKEKFIAAGKSGFYPVQLIEHGGMLISEQREISSSKKKLVTYHGTGLGKQEIYIGQEIVYFASRNDNELFVFGNMIDQGVIEIYDVQNNALHSPHSLPPGKILSVARIDPNTYFIAHENKIIYRYNEVSNSLIPYLTGVLATHINYDVVTGELFVVEGNKVSTYVFPLTVLKNSVSHKDTILNIHFLYNK